MRHANIPLPYEVIVVEKREPQNHAAAMPILVEFERALRAPSVDKDLTPARFALRSYLWSYLGEPPGTTVDGIERLAHEARHFPAVAAILIRSLAVDQLISSKPDA